VIVNAYRPWTVGTAKQPWIRDQPSAQIGAARHDVEAMHVDRRLISVERPARSLLVGVASDASGQIWSVDDCRIDVRGGPLDACCISESHHHARS
jgi:hypothetical protein